MKIAWIVDRRESTAPVIEQGDRPTCLSCATSSAHQVLCGKPQSVEFLHHSSRYKPAGVGQFASVRDVLIDEGQPPEHQWPYDPTIDDSAAVSPAGVAGPFMKAGFDVNIAPDTTRLIAELESDSVPVIGLVTTRRFMVLKNGVLTEPDTHLGRHAVLLVGAATYQGRAVAGLHDGDTLMCIQNSWGPTWGSGGYGLIAPRAWQNMVLVSGVLSTT